MIIKRLSQTFLLGLGILTGLNTSAQQWGNHTLYATQNGTTAVIIDTNGATTHSWTFTTQTAYSTYLLQGGTILRSVKKSGVSFTGGPISGQFQKVDWSGNILWDYSYSSTTHCSHHDIEAMPNGNVMIIAYDKKTASEVTAAGSTYGSEMWPESIIEIQQTGATTGTIVWEWHLWDHLVQNADATKANYQTSIVNNPGLYNINYSATKDFMHANGLDYNPVLDQISFSSHYTNEMYIIDHSTTTAEAATHAGGNSGKGGDFLYRYGNPAAYGATGATVLNVVHDAHFIPEGVPNEGYLVGFVNKGVSSSQSSVDQVLTPRNGYNYDLTLGSAYAPSTYTFRHACNGYTSNQGNSQQLPNGNMLVCMAFLGSIYEVDPAGNTIWTTTPGGTLVHAYRFDDCYINNAEPAQPNFSASTTDLTATSATTYQWYLNGEQILNATNQTYTPTVSGNYMVRTTDANGCAFYYSDYQNFTYTVDASEITENVDNINITIFPNPSNGLINFNDSDIRNEAYDVSISDASGKIIVQKANSNHFDLSGFNNGIYFVKIATFSRGMTIKKVSLLK
jgi:hypothetical protein